MARTPHKSKSSFRTLSFQNLETRALMAGDVSVTVQNGDLRLVGDSLGNQVAIFQTFQQGAPVPGSFYVGGTNGTTINGGLGQTFTGITRDLSIILAGGSDTLTLGDNINNGRFKVPNDLRIDLGNGDNTLAINKITVRDDTFINTGTGADRLDIRGSFGVSGVDSNRNDLFINTGAGADVMRIVNTFVRRDLIIDTGTDTGSDFIDMAIGNVGRNVNILTGAGVDTVAVQQFGINGDLDIDTGADRDVVVISESQVDELFVALGTGGDRLELVNSYGRRATLDGGTGADTLLLSGDVDFDILQRISI